MIQERAFLDTICDQPDDDGPRLVYADWLEERGDPRGEFIRVQCEIADTSCQCQKCIGPAATIPPHLCILELSGLRRRERELLKAHAAEWLSPSPLGFGIVNAGSGQIGWAISEKEVRLGERYVPAEFRRGFVERAWPPFGLWWAGSCETCNGRGCDVDGRGRVYRCAACGTARTPGLAAKLVRTVPLREVRFVDKQPFPATSGAFSWWSDARQSAGTDHPASDLPAKLFKMLEGGIDHYSSRSYSTADAAVAALSDAALRLARQLHFRAASAAFSKSSTM